MQLSKVSIRVSLGYVLVVAAVAMLAFVTGGGGWGLVAAWLLTLGPGTLVLGFLFYLVVPLLDLTGFPMDGPLGLAVIVFGYVLAAVTNVVLILGLITLCRELRGGRRRARARAAGAPG